MNGWRFFRSTNIFQSAAAARKLTGWRKTLDHVLRFLGPSWRAAPIRRLAQTLCLALFFGLFFYVAWPYSETFSNRVLADKEWLPVEVFLWLDPLVGLSAALAARCWNVALIGVGAVLLLSLLFPRGFCGYLCPLGTLVDIFDHVAGARLRRFQIKSLGRWALLKYYLLAAVLVSALCGVLLSGFVAAIPMLTRGVLFTGARLQLGLLKNWAMLNPAGAELYLSIALFAGIFLLSFFGKRFWCRHLCPSGALISLSSFARLFQRELNDRCTRCGKCVEGCAFAAINSDFTTRRLDCASCQTCAGVCPTQAINFMPRLNLESANPPEKVLANPLSRRAFLAAGACGAGAGVAVRAAGSAPPKLLRPPGSVPEAQFRGLCIRCGQCIQVCPGPVLHLAGFDAGFENLWTPVAVPSHAGCHQDCNFCTQVCPTGAIQPLTIEAKRKTHMGLAIVDTSLCLPHSGKQDCRLCFDECNAAGYRAIEMRRIKLPMGEVPEGAVSPDDLEEMSHIAAPFVNQAACVGCGLCEYRCHSALAKQRHLLPRSAVVIEACNK